MKGGHEGPVTFGRAGQWGTLVGLQDGGPGAIRGVFTARRPSQPWLPGEAGGRASGSGGRQEGRTGTPNPSPRKGGDRKDLAPTASALCCLPTPLPPNFSHPEPGAASEAAPLAEGADRLVQARPWGGTGRDPLLSSLCPTPGGWQSQHDGSLLRAGWSGA